MSQKTDHYPRQDAFIHLENLSKSYQEGAHTRTVLRNVTALFAKGESVAILGRSASHASVSAYFQRYLAVLGTRPALILQTRGASQLA